MKQITLRDLVNRIETVRRSLRDSDGSLKCRVIIDGEEVILTTDNFHVDDDGSLVINKDGD